MTEQEKYNSLLNCLLGFMNIHGIETQIGSGVYNQTFEILKENGLEDRIVKYDEDDRFFLEVIFDALDSMTAVEESCRDNKGLHDKVIKIHKDIHDLYYDNLDKTTTQQYS